jgi:hypothetical protein
MIATGLLSSHPGNVREDLDLGEEFCASVAEAGVRIPLQVTYNETGGFRVIEGHRRLAAAVKAGLAEVPCDVDPGGAGDEAGQYLDMLIANGDAYRKNFTPVEEAAALFAAHEAGATRTRLRKATGRKAAEIKTALAVGGISGETRTAAGDLASQLTLDEFGLLAEFDGDQAAVSKLLEAFRRVHGGARGGADPPGPGRSRQARPADRRTRSHRDHGHRRLAGRRGQAEQRAARWGGSHRRGPRRLLGPGGVLPVLESAAAGVLLHQP